MTPDQLRQALKELKGDRTAVFAVVGLAESITVSNAMLIPDEPDHLVKVTDGSSIYVLDAERIAYIRIGLK